MPPQRLAVNLEQGSILLRDQQHLGDGPCCSSYAMNMNNEPWVHSTMLPASGVKEDWRSTFRAWSELEVSELSLYILPACGHKRGDSCWLATAQDTMQASQVVRLP